MKRVALDVGSTTVKIVIADGDKIVWRDYQRHHTRQAEKVREMLAHVETTCAFTAGVDQIHITGSGASLIGPLLGARFVQEVVAVAASCEKLHPEVRFVSEIGGEDMKTVFFSPSIPGADPVPAPPMRRVIPIQVAGTATPAGSGVQQAAHSRGIEQASGKRKQVYMQSACSGGTGTFVEKIARKLGLPIEQLRTMPYDGCSLHKVSSKCGIFAEADANTLVKSGVPVEEIIASLFEAVVYQNLAVLTKGNVPMPRVLLLGGPNLFYQGLQQAWCFHLEKLWRDRGVVLPSGAAPADLIVVPDDALYYACLGCLEVGREDPAGTAVYRGLAPLEEWIEVGQHGQKAAEGTRGLATDDAAFAQFLARHGTKMRESAPGKTEVSARNEAAGAAEGVYLGCDFGSTTAKVVVMSDTKKLLFTAYAQSKGNPIDDAKIALRQVFEAGFRKVAGIALTGYGKDLLKEIVGADLAIVETVAHATAALHFHPDADVICDVGGCDVKIMLLRQGTVADFRLNSQCSSGNGAFLQGVAERYAVPLEQYAERAFSARAIPALAMGCGVFLQSDIVNQQRKGWSADEIMAGLAAVLPLNVWVYAGQLQNLAMAGRTFILQGGTHLNLAVVKAQVDFITGKVPDADIRVHPYPGEAGAIGAALCVIAQKPATESRFRGFDAIEALEHSSTTDEHTTCHWCPVNCRRTFVDVRIPGAAGRPWSKVVLPPGWERVITGNSCPKGLVEDAAEMRAVKTQLEGLKDAFPNVAETLREQAFRGRRAPRETADRDSEGTEHLVNPSVLARLFRRVGL